MAIRSFSTEVIRPADLLICQLTFVDVDFQAPTTDFPGTVKGGSNSLLVVQLQGQNVYEEAYFQKGQVVDPAVPTDEPPDPPGLVSTRIAGPSRLVFSIPSTESFDFTLTGILDAIRRFPLRVPKVSSYRPEKGGCSPLTIFRPPPRPPSIAEPERTETALELPYRLILSPGPGGSWDHAVAEVTHDGRTELWHTRLGSRTPEGPSVRAVWSPDFIADDLQPHSNEPFRASLDGRDRNELVHLTSNYRIGSFAPTPVETESMMLATLGAWLKVQGDWVPPVLKDNTHLTVEQWRHDAAMGRDNYVRVVYAGFLLSFGFRASVVKITERKFRFQDDPPGMVAYLFQTMQIVSRERTREYSNRSAPFRKVTLKTRITPNLADPAKSEVIAGLKQEAFWPRISRPDGTEADFLFHFEGVDWEGRVVEFTAPQIFVSLDVDAGQAATAVNRYNSESVSGARRRRPFAGQSVAFAPATKPGETTYETMSISLGAQPAPSSTPHFLPELTEAQVDVPAVKQLLGKSVPSTIKWEATYLAGSANSIGNHGQVFATVAKVPLAFATEKAGGLVAPNMDITGLSRALGPVGGPVSSLVAGAVGTFKVGDVFKADVKLLAGIMLSEIIRPLEFLDAGAVGDKLPKLTTERIGNVIRTRYKWGIGKAELVETTLFKPGAAADLIIEATVDAPLDGSAPTTKMQGRMTDFAVALAPGLELIKVSFDSVTFVAEQDRKPDVAVVLGKVEFQGPLAFVNDLSSVLPLDGFNDPPNLALVPPPNTGVNVGFTLGLPTVGVGIMTMQNISLAAAFYLPFVDKPANFRFAFCEKEQPFILTVSAFGGGGFFGIELGVDKVTLIEAALEFGASVAINLGVAAGQATIMAGFYYQKAGDAFSLSGYFRASGSLSVLGIITISCEFYLGLTYASKGQPHGGMMWGKASLTVKIKILFFSKSVSVSMERELAGSDPGFRELVSAPMWAAYCSAYDDYPLVPED